MGSFINGVYQGDVSQGQGGVFVNATLKLTYEPRTIRPSLAGELQRHLLGVIHRRSNNIGNSALYVDSPPGSISNLQGQHKKRTASFLLTLHNTINFIYVIFPRLGRVCVVRIE